MAIIFKSAESVFAGDVKMDAHEHAGLQRVLDCHAIIERNKDVRVSGHDRFYLGFAQLPLEALGHIKSDHLFRWAVAAIRAAILPAVSGIYYDSRKRFARILDAMSAHAAASCQ